MNSERNKREKCAGRGHGYVVGTLLTISLWGTPSMGLRAQDEISSVSPIERLEGIDRNVARLKELRVKDPRNHALDKNKFSYPNGLTADRKGNIYVTDTGNARVVKLDTKGDTVGVWGTYGDRPGEFDLPSDVAVYEKGRDCAVYVADTMNNRIQQFTCEGKYVRQSGRKGEGKGELSAPHGLDVDKNGNVYVADTLNHRIVKFAPEGGFVTMWGTFGAADGEMQFPHDVAIDKKGDLLLTDFLNHRIQKFDANGTFLAKWGGHGSALGQFEHPWGIAIDNKDRVWVADMSNHRIQVFSPKGKNIGGYGKYKGRAERIARKGEFRLQSVGFDHPKGLALPLSADRGTWDGRILVAHPGAHSVDFLQADVGR